MADAAHNRTWPGSTSSVLASMRGAAVVVDRDLNVLVWNHRAEDLWGLRADEVRGKSVLNLDVGLPVGELRSPLRACLVSPARPARA